MRCRLILKLTIDKGTYRSQLVSPNTPVCTVESLWKELLCLLLHRDSSLCVSVHLQGPWVMCDCVFINIALGLILPDYV